MVIALLTLPAATALQFSQRLWSAMLVASALCFLFTLSGIVVSYGPELPAGATVIQVAGVTYLLALVWKRIRSRNVG
jgi:zinc transport system permease protein